MDLGSVNSVIGEHKKGLDTPSLESVGITRGVSTDIQSGEHICGVA